MKKIIMLALIFCVFQANSQTNPTPEKNIKIGKGKNKTSSDALVISLNTDIWQKVPDSIAARGINQGVSAAGMYNIRMGQGNFSFAFGLGISSHNFYSDGILGLDTTGKISQFTPTSISYKINKLSLTYFDIPVEFRFKTSSKFRIAVGFKFGFTMDVHTKYKGTDLSDGEGSVLVKEKKIANIEPMSYALTARIGYKWAILNASYSLNSIFKKDVGPQMYPISVGITVIPF